jgi:benzoate-CoA ligase family protein
MTGHEIRIPEQHNASLLLDRQLAAGYGQTLAILSGEGRLTYAELFAQMCRTGAALRELGAHAGDRVLLVLDDSPAFPALFLGAIRVGIVPVPVNPFCRGDEYQYFVRNCGAALVVTDRTRADTVVASIGGALPRDRILSIDSGSGLTELGNIAVTQPSEIPPVDTHRDDVAFWLYSSGSTGRPKGVVHLQHDILFTCESYARDVLRVERGDVTFSTTKLFHAYGLGNNLSFPYWAGATTVLMSGRVTPARVFDTIAQSRPTLFFSTPTVYNALLHAASAPSALDSIRLCVSAAEPLPAAIWERWRDRYGLVILDGIGSTEMLHIYCSNRQDDCVPGSSGRPVPGYDIKLVDERGIEVAGAGHGELHVRGDSALAEYWQQPQKTAEAFCDGWFSTRDRYRRDADGRYWYEGRSDDMFKVSGLWVSPVDVEGQLMNHPAVVECAVIGVDVDGFVRPKAFVVLQPGIRGDEALSSELATFCGTRLHRFQVPASFSFINELPKTVTGKVQRFTLRERST